ncbi:MAG: glycosyltransferase family 9 protein, partial [Phycisphaerales bacterium]|nr:glycosyltransferase family 9 protein [Phycisphaerales bacterium]
MEERMTGGAIPRDSRTVAIVTPSWIGDLVMATPVFRALHHHRPEATRLAIVRPGQDELLAGCPWFDDVIVDGAKSLAGPWRTGRLFRRHHVDAVLLLPNSARSALSARLGGVRIRVGYDRDHRGLLLTHRIPYAARPTPTSTVDDYADLAIAALGVDDIDRHLELHTTEEQESHAERI